MADSNVAHPQLFPSRTLAPTFHASPLPFSLICSRTWCLLVVQLHCDPTFHTDYVRLSASGLPWRSRVLYATWRFSTCLWIAMCISAHLAHVAVEISDHSPNFSDTPCILIIVQRDATKSSLFIFLQVHSTCFGCQPHPSSGVLKTVITASGTGHIFCAATSLQRDLTWPLWREVAAQYRRFYGSRYQVDKHVPIWTSVSNDKQYLTHSEQTDDQVTLWVSLQNRKKSDLKKKTHTHTHKFVSTL